MLMWHIMLLPLVVVLIVGVHVLLVRRRGVVPPFASSDRSSGEPEAASTAEAIPTGERS
jgi:quinol-cytochrome oxidoreductase complex cytochrome b subunit